MQVQLLHVAGPMIHFINRLPFTNLFDRFMIVLFTGGDDLQYHDRSLSEYVDTLPDQMKQFIKQCGNRYMAFNNRCEDPADKEIQRKQLLAMIDDMIQQNNVPFCTNSTLDIFEKEVNQREMHIRIRLEKEKEDEIRAKEKEMEDKWMEREKEMDKKIHKIKEDFDEKIAKVREEVREEVEKDKPGSGELIEKCLKKLAVAFGKAVIGVATKALLTFIFL